MTEYDRRPQQGPDDTDVAAAPSTPVAGAPAPAAAVPYEDVTLVLIVKSKDVRHAGSWVEQIEADPDLSRCHLVVVKRGSSEHEALPGTESQSIGGYDTSSVAVPPRAMPPVALPPMVELSTSIEPSEAETLEGYTRVFEDITTRWFCMSTLTQSSARLDVLKLHLARETERVSTIGLTSDRPVLLYSSDRSRTPPRLYIHRELERLDASSDPVMRDYLGFLALATSSPQLEGVDLRAHDRELELFGRVPLGRFNSHEPPPWAYRFVVARPNREVLAEGPAEPQQRLDNKGDRRWENLLGRLVVDDIPEGDHRLMIGLETPFAPLRSLQPLRPRPGSLAPARTVLLGSEGGRPSAPETRYLVHTVRGGHAWITLQRGVGEDAATRWDRALARKDLRVILKGKDSRRMRLARLVRLVTRPWFRPKEIWLVGERADTAQDNGFHFFRHLRENAPDRRVYYIIDKDSPQRSRVAPLGNVVAHSSVRHRLLMMHATVLANAYSIKHMIPRQWGSASYTRSLAWRVGAHRVYLKHGVHVSPQAVKRGTGGYDLYLAVNPMERAALQESSGYRDQVVETGMPRYDTLLPTPSTRTILFMPTWRRYLVPKLFGSDDVAKVPYEGSTYERFITGLLHSPRLHEILTRHDFRLQLLPHYNLRQEMDDFEFTSDRTELADTTKNSFQDLIRGCDAFLTDYSSVHFDVAYVGTPIIYAHFDKDDYEDGHAVPSWFDHDKDAFGPVVTTLDETLTELDALLSRGCTRDPAFQPQIDAAFTFHDHNNSARAVQEVDAMLDRARRGV